MGYHQHCVLVFVVKGTQNSLRSPALYCYWIVWNQLRGASKPAFAHIRYYLSPVLYSVKIKEVYATTGTKSAKSLWFTCSPYSRSDCICYFQSCGWQNLLKLVHITWVAIIHLISMLTFFLSTKDTYRRAYCTLHISFNSSPCTQSWYFVYSLMYFYLFPIVTNIETICLINYF